tara:strand:+ start:141 stop:470 length:330 start_codon:yes stop_codon:yes gene_type:complete
MRDPRKNVTFTFKCYEKESADLKIRLRYDGLQQSKFFRALLKMYVEQDPLMIQVVDKIKEKHKIMGKRKRANSIKDLEAGQDILDDFGISGKEKEDLFDLIATETDLYE